jgi:hypothetical protein
MRITGKGSRSKNAYNKEVDLYKWFVVDLKNKKIVAGNEFREDAIEALEDYDGDKNFKVVSKISLKRLGIEEPSGEWKHKFADGGEVIEEYDDLPEHVQEALYEDYDEDNDPYKEAEKMRGRLQEIGWDMDYDLSGTPTEFWEIEKKSKGGDVRERKYVNKSEDYEVRYAKGKSHRKGYKMAKGGGVDSQKTSKYAVIDNDTDRIYVRGTDKDFIEKKYKELKEIYPNSNLIIQKFDKGGEIESKIAKLEKLLSSTMIPESAKETTRKKIATLKASIKKEEKAVVKEVKKELTKITQKEWETKKKHGYTSVKDGQKYILTNENGATVLAPVSVEKVEAKSELVGYAIVDPISVDIMVFEETIEKLIEASKKLEIKKGFEDIDPFVYEVVKKNGKKSLGKKIEDFDLSLLNIDKKDFPAKESVTAKIPMEYIEILWAEGTADQTDKFPKKYTSLTELRQDLKPLVDKDAGYNKTKFIVKWVDGEEYGGRLDISEKEDNPNEHPNVIKVHIMDFFNYQLARDSDGLEEHKEEIRDFIAKYSFDDFKSEKAKSPVAKKKVDEIDMDEIEKTAIYYTDDSKWSPKPTIAKFEKELEEYKLLKRKFDDKRVTHSSIIGKGHKPELARGLADKWLKEQILIAEKSIEILKERAKKQLHADSVLKKSETYHEERKDVYGNPFYQWHNISFEGDEDVFAYSTPKGTVIYGEDVSGEKDFITSFTTDPAYLEDAPEEDYSFNTLKESKIKAFELLKTKKLERASKSPVAKKKMVKKVATEEVQPQPKFKVGERVEVDFNNKNYEILEIKYAFNPAKGKPIFYYSLNGIGDIGFPEYSLKKHIVSKPKPTAKTKGTAKKVVAKIKAKKGAGHNDRGDLVEYGTDSKERRSRSTSSDKKRTAKPLGKRVSAEGNVYYEHRLNRGDVDPKEKFEEGGEIYSHKHSKGWGEDISIKLIEPTSKGWKVEQTTKKGKSAPKNKIAYFSKSEIEELFDKKFAKGGELKSNGWGTKRGNW